MNDMVFIQDVTEGFEEQSNKEKLLFEKAYKLAQEAHKDQKRDEGTPYIAHIDGIIDILTNEINITSYRMLTVAALHDVVEDSEYTKEDISNLFDPIIAEQVDLLTKTKNITIDEYIDRMKNYKFRAIVITIKLADRLHNVRSLKNIVASNKNKVMRYITETENYYIPLSTLFPNKLHNLLVSELLKIKELV